MSDELANRLLSQTDKASIVDSRNAVNQKLLVEISNLDYDELQRLFGISEEFCLVLEDDRGEVILVDGKYGVGSTGIFVNGIACSAII